MASGRGDIPALESGMVSGFCAALSCPIGITRHNISYDEHMESPMHSPPPDMNVNILWKDPVIPKHRFRNAAEEHENGGKFLTLEGAAPPLLPVVCPVKTKATSLMSSLMIKQTQENLQKFEHQAGLADDVYSPHKGLSAEETRSHRLVDGTLPKLKMPSGDFKEDRLTTSAQSTPAGTPSVTPCVSPLSSPAVNRRNWLQQNPAPLLAPPESHIFNPNTDMGGTEGGNSGGGGGGGLEKWSFFKSQSVVQKSPTDPGCDTNKGFSLQSYFGLHKSSTIDGTTSQINRKVDDPAKYMPVSRSDPGTTTARPHKLKPRDMNVLTPSGF